MLISLSVPVPETSGGRTSLQVSLQCPGVPFNHHSSQNSPSSGNPSPHRPAGGGISSRNTQSLVTSSHRDPPSETGVTLRDIVDQKSGITSV